MMQQHTPKSLKTKERKTKRKEKEPLVASQAWLFLGR